jgi:hypothetical protein
VSASRAHDNVLAAITIGIVILAVSGCADETPAQKPTELGRLPHVMRLALCPDGQLFAATMDLLGAGGIWAWDPEAGEWRERAPWGALWLVCSEAHVYFAQAHRGSSSPGVVARVPLAGGDVEVYVEGILAGGVAVDAEHVYWLETGMSGGLFRAPIEGGSSTRIVATDDAWGYLAMDETHAYWITTGGFVRADKETGAREEILPEEAYAAHVGTTPPAGFILHDDDVYWVAGAPYREPPGGVLRMAKDGSGLELLAGGQRLAAAVAVDDTHVYWSRGEYYPGAPADGRCDLVRIPRSGGPEERLAVRQNGIFDIVLTDESVIWDSLFDGRVRELAKD